MRKLLYLLSITILPFCSLLGQAGRPDTSFGNKGVVRVSPYYFGEEKSRGKQVFDQTTGSLVTLIEVDNKSMLVRHSASGSPDRFFGRGGTTSPLSVSYPIAAILPDEGFIIAANNHKDHSSTTELTLFRYDREGIEAPAFGSNGSLTIDLGIYFQPKAIITRDDGSILIAGHNDYALSQGSGTQDFIIISLKPDGTLDSGFGNHGFAITEIPNRNDSPADIALQKDGKIVVGGNSSDLSGEGGDLLVARYLPDGRADNTFGSSGVVLADYQELNNRAGNIAIQADEQIIISGYIMREEEWEEEATDITLTRFTASGVLDTGFGAGGWVIFDYTEADFPNGLITQKNGTIRLAATVISDADPSFPLIPDPRAAIFTFSGAGELADTFFPFPDNNQNASDLLLKQDGRIVLTGTYDTKATEVDHFTEHFLLVRLLPNGVPDSSFTGDGRLIGSTPFGTTAFNSVLVTSDGKTVAGSSVFDPQTLKNRAMLFRFNPDGSPDSSFATNGSGFLSGDFLIDIEQQQDNKILVLTSSFAFNPNFDFPRPMSFQVIRLHPDGTVDSSFGTNGSIGSGIRYYANAMTIAPDNKILVTGSIREEGEELYQPFLKRYDADGANDPTFAADWSFLLQQITPDLKTPEILVQKDLHVLVTGFSTAPGPDQTGKLLLARFKPDGSPDAGFGTNGIAATSLWGENNTALLQQPDEKILFAGRQALTNYPALARFNPDGTTDTSFGSGGILVDSIYTTSHTTSLLQQADLKILEVRNNSFSNQSNGHNRSNILIRRYLPEGGTESSFNKNGTVATDTNGFSTNAPAAAIAGERLVVAGSITPDGRSFEGLLLAFRLDCLQAFYADNDGDGYGNKALVKEACQAPAGYVADNTDCDDLNAAINPGQIEQIDGIDNDCDLQVDEPFAIVQSFTLIEATGDQERIPLENNSVINLATIPGRVINIKTSLDNNKAGSVVLQLTGQQLHSQTENTAPYALFGNKDNDYLPWHAQPGSYTLTATPYTEKNGKGVAGVPLTISFTITDEITLDGITLLDVQGGGNYGKLTDGQVIDLAGTPQYNLRAESGIGIIGSVVFGVNENATYRVENNAPFTLAGNKGTEYFPWLPTPGDYTITATPYSGKKGTGTKGTATVVSIKVVNSALPLSGIVSSTKQQQTLAEKERVWMKVAPNPVISEATLVFTLPKTQYVSVSVLDAGGKKVSEVFAGMAERGQQQRKTLTLSGLPGGVYFVRLLTASGDLQVQKLVKQ